MLAKFLLLTFLVVGPIRADIVHLAAEDSWPPYALSDGLGISSRIISASFKEMGYKVKFSAVPYVRALQLTRSGDVDGCFNVTRQKSTEDQFIFGEEVLLKASASFYYSNKSKIIYTSINDIPKGSSIAVIRGYEYGDEFEKVKSNFSISEVNSQEQIIRMISSGRIVGAVMFDEVAKYYFDKMRVAPLQKGFLNHESDIYVAFSKKRPKSKHYSQILDKGIRLLKDKGKYKNILNSK